MTLYDDDFKHVEDWNYSMGTKRVRAWIFPCVNKHEYTDFVIVFRYGYYSCKKGTVNICIDSTIRTRNIYLVDAPPPCHRISFTTILHGRIFNRSFNLKHYTNRGIIIRAGKFIKELDL